MKSRRPIRSQAAPAALALALLVVPLGIAAMVLPGVLGTSTGQQASLKPGPNAQTYLPAALLKKHKSKAKVRRLARHKFSRHYRTRSLSASVKVWGRVTCARTTSHRTGHVSQLQFYAANGESPLVRVKGIELRAWFHRVPAGGEQVQANVYCRSSRYSPWSTVFVLKRHRNASQYIYLHGTQRANGSVGQVYGNDPPTYTAYAGATPTYTAYAGATPTYTSYAGATPTYTTYADPTPTYTVTSPTYTEASPSNSPSPTPTMTPTVPQMTSPAPDPTVAVPSSAPSSRTGHARPGAGRGR
jgi:hypothetical protein